MKNYFKIITVLVFTLAFTSCLVEEEASSANNDQGQNLASFTNNTMNIGGIANGDEYNFDIKVEVKGPTISEFTSDVTMTLAVDPSSTAIEGTHFKFNSKTITLSKSGNYIGLLPITLLSEGIIAPLAVSPILYLKVSSASGGGTVNNGKLLKVTLNYLCFSNLAGAYSVTTRYVRPSAGIDQTTTSTDVIDEVGPGAYRTQNVGHWTQAQLGGTPGFDFIDVCNTLTIPAQNLVNLYSNIVQGVAGESSVNPDTGVITFRYTIVVPPATADREYFITYTPL